jgi:hypothetical protein
LTVTTTKLMQNMMWAMMIVPVPSGAPRLRNRASSEAPRTTSGVAIGRKISRFVAARPLKRCRTSANEMSVPSRVATAVEMTAICRLTPTASQMVGSRQMLSHASSENWFQTTF